MNRTDGATEVRRCVLCRKWIVNALTWSGRTVLVGADKVPTGDLVLYREARAEVPAGPHWVRAATPADRVANEGLLWAPHACEVTS